jgi:hypothetical protein
MAGGRPHRVTCRVCQTSFDDPSILSKRGKCPDCADWLREQNIKQLAAHRGPFFEHWYASMHERFEFARLDAQTARD